MPVKPIPDGYHSVSAYLIVDDAAKAIDFYGRAFGARELYRLTMPDGGIGHAEIEIGDTRVMLADEAPRALVLVLLPVAFAMAQPAASGQHRVLAGS